MRGYTPLIYDLSKCINAFYCHVQLVRTNKIKNNKKRNVEVVSATKYASSIYHLW